MSIIYYKSLVTSAVPFNCWTISRQSDIHLSYRIDFYHWTTLMVLSIDKNVKMRQVVSYFYTRCRLLYCHRLSQDARGASDSPRCPSSLRSRFAAVDSRFSRWSWAGGSDSHRATAGSLPCLWSINHLDTWRNFRCKTDFWRISAEGRFCPKLDPHNSAGEL